MHDSIRSLHLKPLQGGQPTRRSPSDCQIHTKRICDMPSRRNQPIRPRPDRLRRTWSHFPLPVPSKFPGVRCQWQPRRGKGDAHPRVKSYELQTSTLHHNQGCELPVGVRRVRLRRAAVEFRRAFTLARRAPPYEVSSSSLTSRDSMFLLQDSPTVR